MRESAVLQNENVLDVELNIATVIGDMTVWSLFVNGFFGVW